MPCLPTWLDNCTHILSSPDLLSAPPPDPHSSPYGSSEDYTPTGVFATDFEKYVELNDAFPVEIATIAAAPAAAAAAASEDEPEPATKMRGSAKPRIELGAASPEEEEAGHPQWIRIAGWTVDPPMMNALIPTCNASETLSTIKFWNAGLYVARK